MALEDLTGTKYISDLVSTNPASSDNKSEGDDHLRGIKNVLKTTFPNVSGAITPTQTEINKINGLSGTSKAVALDGSGNLTASASTDTELGYLSGVTSSIQTQLDNKAPKFSGAYVTKSATQSITAGTSQEVTFDTEQHDTDGFHDNATNNTRLTVPSGVSRARIFGVVSWVGLDGDARAEVYIKKNGSTLVTRVTGAANSGGAGGDMYASTPALSVSSGDYFELSVLHDSSTAKSVNSNYTYFAIEAVG